MSELKIEIKLISNHEVKTKYQNGNTSFHYDAEEIEIIYTDGKKISVTEIVYANTAHSNTATCHNAHTPELRALFSENSDDSSNCIEFPPI